MGDTLFHMWGPFRKNIIDSHTFYVEQAQQRLLSQFQNVEQEADKYGAEWLENTSHLFDPERDDPGDFYQQAYEESISFYEMLDNMRNRTRLSVVAGMFHEWEKQLRSWTLKEITNWQNGEEVKKAVWKANFKDIIDLFENLGWPITTKKYYASLNKCRLVVNAFKHGNGDALEEIRRSYPELLVGLESDNLAYIEYSDHTDLKIETTHIDEFSTAITAFWKDVPEYIINKGEYENIPKWFEKAYKKDANNTHSETRKAAS
mgnify:CR=1 FL=1